MFKLKILYLILFIGVVFTTKTYAQTNPEMLPEGDFEGFQSSIQEKAIEPKIELYNLNGFGAYHDTIKIDTLLDYYHLYHPAFKNAVSVSYLGNYGLPYLNNDFFGRETEIDFFFSKTREAYLLTPDKIKYYNTRTPYTLLDYSQSENKSRKNETRFNVLHTQNINPFLNFTFQYDQARSDGQYNFQNSKNNLVSIYSSYSKNQIQIHSGFISNSMQNNENGGLEDDSSIFNGTESEYLNVNLKKTNTKFSNSYYFATGEYRFGKFVKVQQEQAADFDEMQELEPEIYIPFVGLIYSVQYQRHYKQFNEDEDSTNTFFPVSYFDDNYIKDSIRFNKISNIFQIKQYEDANRKTSFGKRAFIGQEFVKISSPGAFQDEYYRRQKKYSNVYIGGGIFRQTGNFWTWNAEGKFYLLGRNIGQTELSGVISKPFTLFSDSLASITIRGDIQNRLADFFQEEFYSNHIRWNNDFKMEQNMTVRGSFKSPERKIELGANYSLINNFIYNDLQGKPAQTAEELLVVSLFADKEFIYRNLHFRARLLYQKTSNEAYIHVPDFSAFVSGYYKFIVSKVLFTQIGVDARYNTSYYGDAYDPSTGLFYLQNEIKTGNFPYIDVYANLKLKRTRLFFKMMNVGTSFMNKPYFTTPHYPMPRMTFRMGVAWAFYD
jgi:hypothetical protein